MEDEGEIECLEEDEDLVLQLLQNTQVQAVQNDSDSAPLLEDENLLVERKQPREYELKRKQDDDDSDYDPSRDTYEIQRKKKKYGKKYSGPNTSTTTQLVRKQDKYTKLNPKILNMNQSYEDKLKSLPNLTVKKQPASKPGGTSSVVKPVQERKVVKRISYSDLVERRKLDIRIPDYEDPICLPVRALKQDEYDLKRLTQWNKLCLEQYRKIETPLKSFRGGIPVKSTRLLVLRNVKDKNTGKINTSVYGNTSVTDSRGDSKSESYQSVLPKYREKKILSNYPLAGGALKLTKHVYEVVLSREQSKTEDTLVVYKPKEAVSAVYKFSDKTNNGEQDESKVDKRVLEEVTCVKACAPCYHTSWRGVSGDSEESLPCPICQRKFSSVYSLLTHLKNTHTNEEVRRARTMISEVLAKVVQYHYKCRICQEKFSSIKERRKHVAGSHQGVEVFKCEVGNHMAS